MNDKISAGGVGNLPHCLASAVTLPPILFHPGSIVLTTGADAAFAACGDSYFYYLLRHMLGDWEEMRDAEIQSNRVAVQKGGRVFSRYYLIDCVRIYVITESDRSRTTVLLPSEY